MAAQSLVVIGGCVLDIQAAPSTSADVRPGGSVPGSVKQLPGGVGRNIAEAATKLLAGSGREALLISVVGRDAAGDSLLASCSQLGMPTRAIIRSKDAPTPSVCTILDGSGEVAASVASLAAFEQEMTPGRIAAAAADVRAAGLLVVDANLSEASFAAACSVAASAHIPTLFEPVSVPKAVRCAPVIDRLQYITPNAAELIAIANAIRQRHQLPALPAPQLAGCTAQQQLSRLQPCALAVLSAGCGCIILTMGEAGAALLTRGAGGGTTAVHLPALPTAVVSVSGAGDCLTAGFAAAKLRGCSDPAALAAGVVAATAAVSSPANVPSELSFPQLERQAARLARRAEVLQLPALTAKL